MRASWIECVNGFCVKQCFPSLIAVTDAPGAALQSDRSPKIQEILATPADKRTGEEKQTLAAEFRKTDSERAELAAALAKLKAEDKGLISSVPTTLVMRERSSPRTTFIHLRGDFLSKGREVAPDVPAVLPPCHAAFVAPPQRSVLPGWTARPGSSGCT